MSNLKLRQLMQCKILYKINLKHEDANKKFGSVDLLDGKKMCVNNFKVLEIICIFFFTQYLTEFSYMYFFN